jgi:hypothetical protein
LKNQHIKKIFISSAILIFILLLFSSFIICLPYLVEYKVREYFSKIDSDAQFDGFKFDYFSSFSLESFSFRLKDRLKGRIDHVTVEFDPFPSLLGKTSIRKIFLEGPSLDVELSGPDLLKKTDRTEKSGEGSAGVIEKIQRFFDLVPEISISEGSLKINGLKSLNPNLPENLDVKNIEIIIRNISIFRDSIVLDIKSGFYISRLSETGRIEGSIDLKKKNYLLSISFDDDINVSIGEIRISVKEISADSTGILSINGIRISKGSSQFLHARKVKLIFMHKTALPVGGQKTSSSSILQEFAQAMKKISGILFNDMQFSKVEIVKPEFDISFLNIGRLYDMNEEKEGEKVTGELLDEKLSDALSRTKTEGESSFRNRCVSFFENLESKYLILKNSLPEMEKLFIIDEFDIKQGNIEGIVSNQIAPSAEKIKFSNFYFNIKKSGDGNSIEVKINFESPEIANSENSISGSFSSDSSDLELHFKLNKLLLMPYRSVFPSFIRFYSDSFLHSTDLKIISAGQKNIVNIQGEFFLDDVTVEQRDISTEPMKNMKIGLQLKSWINFTEKKLEISEAKLHIKKIILNLHGTIEKYNTKPVFKFEAELDRTACSDIKDSLPGEVLGDIKDAVVDGSFAFKYSLFMDSSDLSTLRSKFDLDLNDVIVLDLGKSVNIDLIQTNFLHRIEEAGGNVIEREIGPQSPEWISLEEMSPYLIQAVTTTEDSNFFEHHGFSPYAIQRSMIRNLEKGKFSQGGSTITQQLTKNLFLSREKTISRKFQEAFITWQIERLLSKEKIIELYFNIIEFGPEIYGIREASRQYFGKEPKELSLLESAFLVSLIPNPRKYYEQYQRGEVSETWRQKLERLIKIMYQRGKITLEEYNAAYPFKPKFNIEPPKEKINGGQIKDDGTGSEPEPGKENVNDNEP